MVGFMAWAMAGVGDQQGWRKGPWTPEEDKLLTDYITQHGDGRWSSVARCAGLNRSGKSCRLRWVNYLRPGLKRCQITPQEEGIIIELHALWGNKWSTIARYLPGRTDNEIKNYWRTHFKKREKLSSQKAKGRKIQVQKQNQQPKQRMQLPPPPLPLEQQQKQLQEAKVVGETRANTMKEEVENKFTTTNYVNMEDGYFAQLLNYPNSQDVTNHDDTLWSGSLWSFNEPEGARYTTQQQELGGQQMQEQVCSKVANMQNQATFNNFNGFSWGSGDYTNYNVLYNEGYIF